MTTQAIYIPFFGDGVEPTFFVKAPTGAVHRKEAGLPLELAVDTSYELLGFVTGPPGARYEVSVSVCSPTYRVRANRNPLREVVPTSGNGWFALQFSIRPRPAPCDERPDSGELRLQPCP